MDKQGNRKHAMQELYLHWRRELEGILRRGKIETIRYCNSGPRKNLSVPKDVLKFWQHLSNLLLRRLGLGSNKVVEERTVLLRGSTYFLTLIKSKRNQKYTIGMLTSLYGTFLEMNATCSYTHKKKNMSTN